VIGYTVKVRTNQTVLLSVGLPANAIMNRIIPVVIIASVVVLRIIGVCSFLRPIL